LIETVEISEETKVFSAERIFFILKKLDYAEVSKIGRETYTKVEGSISKVSTLLGRCSGG